MNAKVFLIGLLGGVVGAAGAVSLSSLIGSVRHTQSPVATGLPHSGSPAHSPSWDEARVARLEAAAARGEPAISVAPPVKTTAKTTPSRDRQQAIANEAAAQEQRLTTHDREQRDGAWAPATENAIRQSLEALSEAQKLSVQRIDCRSKTCVAELKWPSRNDAERALSPVVQSAYSSCLRTLFLPPADGEGEFHADLVFECR